MKTAKLDGYNLYRKNKETRNLRELLPLDTPLSLMIDPSNICNFKCVFCPTGDEELLRLVGRTKGLMSLELFYKIVDDLNQFPKQLEVLHLYKDGEPLVNKSLAEMVRYAKEKGCAKKVETTTNGALLTFERSKQLIEAGLDGIRISIYSLSDKGYLEATGTPVEFEKIRKNVENFYLLKEAIRPNLHIHCKILDTGMKEEIKNKFLSIFSPISDSVHIDSINGWSNSLNRDLTLGMVKHNEPHSGERIVCPEPFWKLAVNHDGTVSACCVDWAHKLIVGDAKIDSLLHIWGGEKLRYLRLKHLNGKRFQIDACNSCDFIRVLQPHSNLDHFVNGLLPNYSD